MNFSAGVDAGQEPSTLLWRGDGTVTTAGDGRNRYAGWTPAKADWYTYANKKSRGTRIMNLLAAL